VVSAECHSPIIALSQGTPAFYVRNPADTVKAQMFRDIGRTACQSIVDLAAGATPKGVVNPEVFKRPGFVEKWQRLSSGAS
jgi:hypothetical protein